MSGEEKSEKETPSQTAGPYVHIGLMPNHAGLARVYPADLGAEGPKAGATSLTLSGTVYDGAGEPVRDAVIECHSPDGEGADFQRAASDADSGVYRLRAARPGPITGPEGKMQAPHLTLWIVARGINIGLHTRCYFDDESAANAADPILALVPEARRQTLIATRTEADVFRFDIRLQGEGETVFFDA